MIVHAALDADVAREQLNDLILHSGNGTCAIWGCRDCARYDAVLHDLLSIMREPEKGKKAA